MSGRGKRIPDKGRFGDDVLASVKVTVNLSDLICYDREKAVGFVRWIKSEAGVAWLEDLRQRDRHYRSVAAEHMGERAWRFKMG